ncbi:tellurium resistance protein TerD [Fictibacillus macauensis ZFHKF-1]|uniref:Tellurium resistance protein TerD n=1 Tax=Fictibacillus macauensis ZFHKF-1 TaxID=1196324 RepID=I8UH17_9BACL|nr:TerD family protein [Fictibacillus macauensis]EIT86195.1 tellurium resistance protein TerD [Fictibacillus macauensis ZFHKF-1]
MGISLAKGQKVDLTKGNPGLTSVVIGLGWDTNKYDGGSDFDLDSSAFLLTNTGKVGNEKDFVFFNNLQGGNGSVVHTGDNLTGAGDGDDEQIKIDLAKIPAEIDKVAFTITIHDAEARSQNFGQVSNSFVRVINEQSGEELIRYDLGEDFSIETAIVVAELYRHNGEWKFNAIGSGFQGGLAALATNFGLQVN